MHNNLIKIYLKNFEIYYKYYLIILNLYDQIV